MHCFVYLKNIGLCEPPIQEYNIVSKKIWLWNQCKNFKLNLGINTLSIQVPITLEWMPENFVDDNSILVQAMTRTNVK